ncbi:MAG: alpha/beta hydrolase [Pirellulales bacterium]|nr:alpha/beta hydrolase [Pirellulales bacterium]
MVCRLLLVCGLLGLPSAVLGDEPRAAAPPAADSTNGLAPADAAAKPKLEHRFFDSAGVKIRYVDVGQGEPVLLIHGFTANIEQQWRAPGILDALAKNYRVIALDNRGHGGSGKPHDPKDYGLEMAADPVRLLDHLGIDRAHIVGYSMGGMITNKLLSMHPERFITATLGGMGWVRENDESFAFLGELAESLETKGSIRPLIERLIPPDRPRPTDEQLRAVDQMFMLVNDTKALAAVARAMPALSISEEKIRANQVPVLALIGDADPLEEGVDRLVGVMPHLKVVRIPGADHMQAFGDPLFLKELQAFLAEHALAPAAAK